MGKRVGVFVPSIAKRVELDIDDCELVVRVTEERPWRVLLQIKNRSDMSRLGWTWREFPTRRSQRKYAAEFKAKLRSEAILEAAQLMEEQNNQLQMLDDTLSGFRS